MNKKHDQTPECVVYLLSKAYQKGHSLVQNRLKKYGLTNMQYVVLELLWSSEGLTLSETGKKLSIDKATLSGVLDRMVDSGWITKERGNKDRRVYRLYPSDKSKLLKDQLINERIKVNEKLLSGFTAEERILLRRLLLDLL